MAEKKMLPTVPPRRTSKALSKKASVGDKTNITESAATTPAQIVRSHPVRSDVDLTDDPENTANEKQQPISNTSQDDDFPTTEIADMRFTSKAKSDNNTSISNENGSSDKSVKGIKKRQSTAGLISASAEVNDVAKYAMQSKMTTSLGPSNYKRLFPNDRTFVGKGSVAHGDNNNKIMHHAFLGEWGQVEFMVRFSQKNDSDLFMADEETGINAFMLAAKDNKLVIVERLIELGVNVNERCADGRNALHFAAESAKEDVINVLVRKRADGTVKGGEKDRLPMHIACARTGSDSRSIVQALLKMTPFSLRTQPDKEGDIPLFLAIDAGNQGACQDLLSVHTEAQLKFEKPGTGDVALHFACRKRDLEIVRILANFNNPVNHKNADGRTPLHIAAYSGDEAIVKSLYQMKAEANVYDHMDRTPLHVAAERGHTAVVEVLTGKFKSPVSARTKNGSTLMHIAAQCGHPDTAMVFLKKGVPLHMPNKSGAVCLHAAAMNGHTGVVRSLLNNGAHVDARTKENLTALHIAVQHCQPVIVEMLLGHGAPVEVVGGKLHETPLHLASRTKGGEKVAEMLLKSGAEPNFPREDGETATHIAARHGYVETLKLLLEEGGNIMLQSKNDENPLHIAVRHCRWYIVQEALKFLGKQNTLDVTICINMENKEGETCVHVAAELTRDRAHFKGEEEKIMRLLLKMGGDLNYSTKYTKETPLHYAARCGNEEILKIFFEQIGSGNMPTTINRQAKNGWSPLLFASEEGHSDCVYALLRQQARVDVFDENGKAALHLAAENGRLQIAKLLLRYKAFVNAKTKLGLTPLHLAAQNGFNDVVILLIKNHDATIDAISLDKKTPLHKAAENGQYDVCETLLACRAEVQLVDEKGQTPLHLAAENDHSEVIKQFLKHGNLVVTMTNKEGSTCAHIAAAKGSVAVIRELLQFNSENVTRFRNKNQQTALLQAARGGHAAVVEQLLHAGANLMEEDAEGMNALHLLAKHGHTHAINAVKTYGNDKTWTMTSAKTGFNALHVATQFGQEEFAREMLIYVSATSLSETPAMRADNARDSNQEYGYTPLHLASQSGHVNLVRMILNCPGVNVTSATHVWKMTPLHLAAQCGHTAVVGLLLSKDLVQLGTADERGFTSLHHAACHGHLEMVSSLLGQGAEIDKADKNLWTSLHLAANAGFLDMVKLLTEGGASTVLATNNGKIPLQLAAAAGHYAVVSYLLKMNHNAYTLLEDRSFVEHLMQIAVANSSQSAPPSPVYMSVQGGPFGDPNNDANRPVTPRGRAGRVPAHLLPKVMEQRAVSSPLSGASRRMEVLAEFVLASPAPLETAVKLSKSMMQRSNRLKEQSKGLQECARYSENLAVELLGICSAPNGADEILKATDIKGVPFLDVLIDCEQKNVIADAAVQKYLSDVWVGNLDWSDARLILLCVCFLVFPPLWIFFSLPLNFRLNNVPIVKFIVYLVSHIYLIILFIITCAVPLDPIYSNERYDLIPFWYEWMLLVWVSGVLVNELTSPADRTGLGWIRTVVIGFCAIAVVVHLIGFAFTDEKSRQEIIYARNMFLAGAMTLCFVQFLEFLSFHYLFGPWSIIIEGLMLDLFKFGVIVLMFMTAFSMWMAAVYQPVYACNNQGGYCPNATTSIIDNGQTSDPSTSHYPHYTFQLFFYALFGLIEPDILPPVSRSPTASVILVQVVFGLYNIIMLIVLINLLIAMMSDTYQRIEAQSDIEWKFGRSKLIRNMKKTTLSPSPLNLLTTLFQYIKLCCKYRGRTCDPDFSADVDETESGPGPRPPDAHITGTGNRVLPANNARSPSGRSRSLQEIVKWKEVKQKYWASKGRVTSADIEMSEYSLSNEKDLRSERKQNGPQYSFSNGAAKCGTDNFQSSIPLPGEATDQRHDLIS